MLPTAPIPVQTAYAVPNGSDRNAIAINPKLSAIATSVAAAGQNLVSPSEYFRPSAQAISSRPAARSASQPLTAVLFLQAVSVWHIGRSLGTAVRTSDRRRRPKRARTVPARVHHAA